MPRKSISLLAAVLAPGHIFHNYLCIDGLAVQYDEQPKSTACPKCTTPENSGREETSAQETTPSLSNGNDSKMLTTGRHDDQTIKTVKSKTENMSANRSASEKQESLLYKTQQQNSPFTKAQSIVLTTGTNRYTEDIFKEYCEQNAMLLAIAIYKVLKEELEAGFALSPPPRLEGFTMKGLPWPAYFDRALGMIMEKAFEAGVTGDANNLTTVSSVDGDTESNEATPPDSTAVGAKARVPSINVSVRTLFTHPKYTNDKQVLLARLFYDLIAICYTQELLKNINIVTGVYPECLEREDKRQRVQQKTGTAIELTNAQDKRKQEKLKEHQLKQAKLREDVKEALKLRIHSAWESYSRM